MKVCKLVVVLICVLSFFHTNVTALPAGGKELFEPTTGATIILPDNWVFTAEKSRLLAVSDGETGMVLLMKTEGSFEEEITKLETSLAEAVFTDVDLTEAVILVGENRGGFEAAVALKGTAVHRKDGKPVVFAATLVKSGERGSLALGAWKNEQSRETVAEILTSLHVRHPGKGGLELTHKESGATLKLPENWRMMSYRKGLMGVSDDRGAMVLIVKSDDDFEATVKRTRAILTQRVFSNVKIGEFTAVSAVSRQGFTQMVKTSGTARDQVDDKEVEFAVIAVSNPIDNEGLLLVGAWKDESHRKMVQKTLDSLYIKKK